jgi:DNA-binding NarL/FixJ family response regulator
MAEGRTNAVIAAALVISEGAAEKHIANIFSRATPSGRASF